MNEAVVYAVLAFSLIALGIAWAKEYRLRRQVERELDLLRMQTSQTESESTPGLEADSAYYAIPNALAPIPANNVPKFVN